MKNCASELSEHKILQVWTTSTVCPIPQQNWFSPAQEVSLFIVNILYNTPGVASDNSSTVFATLDYFPKSITPSKGKDNAPAKYSKEFAKIC